MLSKGYSSTAPLLLLMARQGRPAVALHKFSFVYPAGRPPSAFPQDRLRLDFRDSIQVARRSLLHQIALLACSV